MPQPVLTTARLVLRPQEPDRDAAFVCALMNDPDWLRHIGDRGVRTPADARAYIRDGAVAMAARFGHALMRVETAAGEPVGLCGLLRRDGFADPDLGFAMDRAHRGRGYAREAAEATLAHARGALGLSRVVALVAPGNAASIRLLTGLGFAFERPHLWAADDLVHVYARALSDG